MWRQGGPEEPSSQFFSFPSATAKETLPPVQDHVLLPSFRAAAMSTPEAAEPTPSVVEETSPRPSSCSPSGASSSLFVRNGRHQPPHTSPVGQKPPEGRNRQPSSSQFLAARAHRTNENFDDDEAPRSCSNSSCRSSPQRTDDVLPDSASLTLINNPQPLHTNRWASPCFFFLGSVLYLWSALYDIRHESTWQNDQNEDDYYDNADTDDADDERQPHPLIDFYVILSSCAALSYVFDAACSFVHLPKWMGLPFQLVCCGRIHYHNHHHHHHNDATGEVLHQEESRSMWPWAVSGTFGLASLMDLASSLTINWTVCPQITNVCAIGAVYVYLLNAAVLLYSKQEQQQQQVDDSNSSSVMTMLSRSEVLEYRGDILFGIGSCIDVALSSVYCRHNVSDAQWKLVNRANLLSTILWLLDSLLYIAAEYYSDDTDQEDDSNQDIASILRDPLEGTDEERICLTPPPEPVPACGNVVAGFGFTPTLEEPLLTDDDKANIDELSSSGPFVPPIFSSSSSFSTLPVVVAVPRRPQDAATTTAAAAVLAVDETNRTTTAVSVGVMA